MGSTGENNVYVCTHAYIHYYAYLWMLPQCHYFFAFYTKESIQELFILEGTLST